MSKLARSFGLSDVGLAKICRKHDIPRPPRGYWAKLQFGQKPRQKPLPNPNNDVAIELCGSVEYVSPSPEVRNAAEQAKSREKVAESRIIVPDSLRGAHQLVSQAKRAYEPVETDTDGLIVIPEDACLTIQVAKANLRRALLIMTALLKALEERGFGVHEGPVVEILGSEIPFEIVERLNSTQETPDDFDLDGHYEFGHNRFIRKRTPSGELKLQVAETTYWAHGCRRSWSDGKKHKLEQRLNSVVSGLIELAARKKEHDQEQQRREEERRAAEQRREQAAQQRADLLARIKAERARVDALLQMAQDWRASQALREYIDAARRRHVEQQGTIEPGSEFAQWVEWALQQADRLDPLRESPPSILDKKVPKEEPPEHYPGYWPR